MAANDRPIKSPAREHPAAHPPERQDHNNPATVEEFDRERMGVAAKE